MKVEESGLMVCQGLADLKYECFTPTWFLSEWSFGMSDDGLCWVKFPSDIDFDTQANIQNMHKVLVFSKNDKV